MTLGADLSPRDAAGEFLGVWRLVGDVGAVAAPAVVGGLAAVLTLGIAAAFTGGIGLIGGAIMILLVRETLTHPAAAAPAPPPARGRARSPPGSGRSRAPRAR